MYMYKGYIIIVYLFTYTYEQINEPTNEWKIYGQNHCNYVCEGDKCVDGKINVTDIEKCDKEDIEGNITYTLHKTNDPFPSPDAVYVYFPQPRRPCKVEMFLYANSSINEDECRHYGFVDPYKNSEKHTSKYYCFFPDNEKRVISIRYDYIFTACYGFRYSVHEFNHNEYFKANFTSIAIARSEYKCKYHTDPKNKSLTTVRVNISIVPVSRLVLKLGQYDNKRSKIDCNNDITKKIIRLEDGYTFANYSQNRLTNNVITNDMYELSDTFSIETFQKGYYCFSMHIEDIRCTKNTVWETSVEKCIWGIYCDCEDCNKPVNSDISDIETAWNNTLIPLVLLIVLFMCLIIYRRRERIKKIVEKLCPLKEEERDSENGSAITTDIVLLYPRGSESFMASMTDFRETLSRECYCGVHDWHDVVEGNHVAEIGGSQWFVDILSKEFSIIWVDVPAMRYLITRKSRDDIAKIGDFRDVLYSVIFDLAKRNVEESVERQQKHFVVRLREFECSASDVDPFVDLSPRRRYLLPRDLNALRSDLKNRDF